MHPLTRRSFLRYGALPFMENERTFTLPDPLIMSNGDRVTSAAAWRKRRRAELLALFASNVYGRSPGRPHGMRFHIDSMDDTALNGRARRKLVTIRFGRGDQPSMNLLIYLPKNLGPVPLFVGVNFRGNQTISADPEIPAPPNWVYNNARPAARAMQANQWPVERILERGYGLATYYAGDMSPDYAGGFEAGVEPLFYRKGQTARNSDEWGALAAWAWGLSRAMDYFQTDHDIDHRRVAVMGHSRMGKAALWAGACDTRFAMVISNCSGAGGATLARRRAGESVKDLCTKFPWWFAENYQKFADNEDALPVDQHELLALSAPRPLYIGVAEGDQGSDPRGQFLAALNAAPVYRLLGADGFGATEMPPLHQPVTTAIGFHIRSGRHDITAYDWDQYMNFADQRLAANTRARSAHPT